MSNLPGIAEYASVMPLGSLAKAGTRPGQSNVEAREVVGLQQFATKACGTLFLAPAWNHDVLKAPGRWILDMLCQTGRPCPSLTLGVEPCRRGNALTS